MCNLHFARVFTWGLILVCAGSSQLRAQGADKQKQSSVLVRRALKGDPEAELALALALERTTTDSENLAAITWLRRAAEHGNPIAQTRLADRYVRGMGTEANRNEALRWYFRAVASGYAPAQYGLARLYLDSGQDREAIHLLEQAAGRSYHPAEADLGLFYLKGRAIAQDSHKAFAYTRRAANGHWPLAEYNLAVMYAKGIGTSPNLTTARHWYRRAEQDGLVCGGTPGKSSCEQNLPTEIVSPQINTGGLETIAVP